MKTRPQTTSRYTHGRGRFGEFGGQFVPETLMSALSELEQAYARARRDKAFTRELSSYLEEYVGRPTPLYHAERLGRAVGLKHLFLKREDLCHTGAHKINNTIGQALLARWMGKRRIIAETGAGQHGVATATAAALFGCQCDVFMGEEDIRRQQLNVTRMRMLGARVIPVSTGSRTLKDACNEALRDWVTNVRDTHYILGSVVGPHPYPTIVRDFQSVIGRETRRQARRLYGRDPDYLVACVGGGSNAIGMFHPFVNTSAALIGVEAAGAGLASGKHAATLSKGTVGVLHGSRSYLLQTSAGQIQIAHSISAGLDYPGVGPEHAYLKSLGRAEYVSVTDREALKGFQLLSKTEGIIPALEPSHAIAYLHKAARAWKRNALVVLCLSGRGDKDVEEVARWLDKD